MTALTVVRYVVLVAPKGSDEWTLATGETFAGRSLATAYAGKLRKVSRDRVAVRRATLRIFES